MEWVEVTGKTVDEAKDAALDQLGVDESDAEFELVGEPKAGLFGLLRAQARVRARVLPAAVRPKVEGRGRGRPPRAGGGGGGAEATGRLDDIGASTRRAGAGGRGARATNTEA